MPWSALGLTAGHVLRKYMLHAHPGSLMLRLATIMPAMSSSELTSSQRNAPTDWKVSVIGPLPAVT